MESSSNAKEGPLPMREAPLAYQPYPPQLAKYEDVVASPNIFMDTLGKLHATMGTKFMIPIIGGKDLDLHRLFVEVTSRGGIQRVLQEKRWKEVTAVFNFPSSATNASYILRKYYMSLLHHYEQIYYFKAKGWSPLSATADASQNAFTGAASTHGLDEPINPSPEIQAPSAKREKINRATWLPAGTQAPSTFYPVMGVIDGKFESGYLVTVTIGSEKLKGVLYQAPQNAACQVPQYQSVIANNIGNTASASGGVRRRRRKKSEMKKRDPAHPKPNRSGYNFFFAEQHAKLKPLHPGKDRDISRMIGELWNKLKEPEKAVYQEKAVRDKERYRIEMEDYKERLRLGQIISDAVPIQQLLPEPDANMLEELDDNIEAEAGDSPHTPQNELSSGRSEKSSSNDYITPVDKDPDMVGVEFGAENVDPTETLADEEAFRRAVEITDEQPLKKQMIGDDREEFLGKVQVETDKESIPGEEKESAVPVEEREQVPSEDREKVLGEESVEKEALPIEEREQILSEDSAEKESLPIADREQVPIERSARNEGS